MRRRGWQGPTIHTPRGQCASAAFQRREETGKLKKPTQRRSKLGQGAAGVKRRGQGSRRTETAQTESPGRGRGPGAGAVPTPRHQAQAAKEKPVPGGQAAGREHERSGGES